MKLFKEEFSNSNSKFLDHRVYWYRYVDDILSRYGTMVQS